MNATHIATLRKFICPQQIEVMLSNTRGEEGQYFRDMIERLAGLVTTMPKTYDQDGIGDAAIVHLHYFRGNMDWFITERDVETPEEPGQHQAFGLADLGYGGELGYISIVELIRAGVDFDLYWTPRTLGEVKAKRAGKAVDFHDDKPDERADMHVTTQPGDLDLVGRPLRPGS